MTAGRLVSIRIGNIFRLLLLSHRNNGIMNRMLFADSAMVAINNFTLAWLTTKLTRGIRLL